MADSAVTGFWSVADAHADRPAVVSADHEVTTFGELAELTHRLVHGFREVGVSAGDQLTTVLPNSVEALATCLAAFQAGLFVTTVNWHLAAPEIAYIVNDSETKALVVHERFADAVSGVLAASEVPERGCLAVGGVEGFGSLDKLLDRQPADRPDDLTAGSYMFYTSGTTGRPKGVRRPLSGLDPDQMAQRSGGLLALFGIEAHDDNVHIVQAPLYHTAVNNWATTSLHLGHTVVLMDRWTPDGALERYERYRVTQSHMVPTMFHRLLALPESVRADFDPSHLRRMVHAAAPCPVETKWRMLDWWGDVIWEYYAATEGGGTIVAPDAWREHPGTVGQAWPMSEVIVVDDDGQTLPAGESGTIYMKMGGAAFEYYKDDEKTRAARLEDYFTVGDVGYFDDDGFLYLNDRRSDMVIVGGVNVYPAEVEGALHQCPLVGDVAVFGVPNPDTGEELKAVIEPAAGVASDDGARAEIMDFLRERIANQKWPRSIDFTEAMPRDPNGKLYKRRLRDPYWVDHDRSI